MTTKKRAPARSRAKATAEKLDLFKLHRSEYVTPRNPVLVDTRRATYLAVSGRGQPGGDSFTAAVGALYGMAYTLKFAQKSEGRDFKVCGLEGLYWGSDGSSSFWESPTSELNWKLLIRVPDFIEPGHLGDAVAELERRGKSGAFETVRLEALDEGRCVQMLHVGPYKKEPDTVAQMMDFIALEHLVPHGLHHEIYLSDPRRVPEERLRTILRFQVKPA